MYHSMDATIGRDSHEFWLYGGTGNYQRINDITSPLMDNVLFGIKDEAYPYYREVPWGTADKVADLTDCSDTTDDTTGALCPTHEDAGWVIHLSNYKKVTAEPTVSSGLVYFPIYKPSSSVNKCSLGDAFICAVDDECGTNISSLLGKNTGATKNEKCKYVGQGVLSRIVTFAGKIFANIAGNVDCDLIKDKAKRAECKAAKDLVILQGATSDVTTYRSSWRNNY